jgi:acyl-CoA synthetase (AMP-forming)/AMP-acid ligase II
MLPDLPMQEPGDGMPDPITHGSPDEMNLAELLWRLDPAKNACPALVDGDVITPYEGLRGRAGAVAAALDDAGVERSERVAILLERGADGAAAIFGSAAVGAVTVSISERLRPRQIEHMLAHSGAKVLITSAALLARLPRRLETGALIVDVATVPASAEYRPVARLQGDAAQILYTSGSTGLPKGVVHSHGSLRAGIASVAGYLGLEADDRVASLLQFSSVYGLNQLLCSVALGSTLVVERSPIANNVAATLRRQGVSVLAAVPPLWLQLLAAPAFRDEPIHSLRILQNAGGHLPVPAVRELRRIQPHARLFLMYGQTETFRGSFLPPEMVDTRPNSIGRAIPGSEIYVLRDDATPCEPGEVGELVQRGPAIALGYWNDAPGTERVFRVNPMRPVGTPGVERAVFTGDMVRRDEDGLLYYVSRRDHLIKTLGFRVGPDEILDVLHASGQISEGVITTEPDVTRGERIVAIAVLAPEGSLDQLNRFCRIELPPHMMPARVVLLEELPRLPGGKLDMLAIQETLTSPSAEREPPQRPRIAAPI